MILPNAPIKQIITDLSWMPFFSQISTILSGSWNHGESSNIDIIFGTVPDFIKVAETSQGFNFSIIWTNGVSADCSIDFGVAVYEGYVFLNGVAVLGSEFMTIPITSGKVVFSGFLIKKEN